MPPWVARDLFDGLALETRKRLGRTQNTEAKVPVKDSKPLLVVGAGLFGSLAAALARTRGIEVLVFDPRLEGAASSAAAGLFREAWAGKKLLQHFHDAVPVLDRLYGIKQVELAAEDGHKEAFSFVPPSAILEQTPIRSEVTSVGDGWLETDEGRYEGSVYVAAGVWCQRFFPTLGIYGKAGASFAYAGEREGQIRQVGPSHQAVAFVRDPGVTHFSDGTAERAYGEEHDRKSLATARAMGLAGPPLKRFWGYRPYVPGGPVFRRIGQRLWLGTGGRKMGMILHRAFARKLVEEEIGA